MRALSQGDKVPVNTLITYRPPGQTQGFDVEMYQVMPQSLHNHEAVILGDFPTQTLAGFESESDRMLEFTDDNFLNQLVTEPTREKII